MRVGCGSATIGMFARQWYGHVDEVIVVDDHITGVLTEHRAGRFLDIPLAGIRVRGYRSTAGRYFRVAKPGTGWGGTDVQDPLVIIKSINPKVARPGLRLLTGRLGGPRDPLPPHRGDAAGEPCPRPVLRGEGQRRFGVRGRRGPGAEGMSRPPTRIALVLRPRSSEPPPARHRVVWQGATRSRPPGRRRGATQPGGRAFGGLRVAKRSHGGRSAEAAGDPPCASRRVGQDFWGVAQGASAA